MRFALLGDHPDGVAMACALRESGRHRVIAYTAALSEDVLRRWGGEARRVSDAEEVLADPAVEAVIVAGSAAVRPAQLRRALQSERHVLCVHPADQTPEIAYEAAMIRNDTGYALLPLLPEATHPAFARLAQFVCQRAGVRKRSVIASPVGAFRLLEMERGVADEVLDDIWIAGHKPSFPGWDILRRLGGEIQEVSAFAEREELREGEPVLVAGRFEAGGLFQATLLPKQRKPSWRLTVIGDDGRADLLFPLGWDGPACLDWRDADGESHEEYWERWDPWPGLIETFERAIESTSAEANGAILPWQDALRALELDDAARRSVGRRRSSVLEYPEATEEVGFKGTMTLVGCAMLWMVLLLLILSIWWPRIGWMIVPLIVVFLSLQFLRYILPKQKS